MLNCITRFIIVVALALTTVIAFGEDERKCPRFRIKKHKVVQRENSEANGAIYLGLTVATSSRDCYKACCDKDDCDMVNLKFENEQVRCFLYNCGSPSKCLFESPTNLEFAKYAALEFGSRDVDESLFSSQISSNTNRDTEKTTEEHVVPTTSKPKFIQPRKQKHRWSTDKEDSGEEDNAWYGKTTTVAPHRNSDVNSDGNDNRNKETYEWPQQKETPTEYHAAREQTKPSTKPPVEQGGKKDYNGYDGSKNTFDRDHAVTNTEKDHEDDPKQGDSTESEAEDFPRRVFVDNNPNYPEKPGSDSKKPRSTNPPSTEKKQTTKPTAKKRENTKKAEKKTEKSTYNNVVIKRFSIQENKAVIPLAVGLVLSLLLLMAVVFRLKTSRRRRTKAFLTDDADYLINGMYL